MNIKYIELKTGYADNGPAWIGNVKESKTGKTIYFNNQPELMAIKVRYIIEDGLLSRKSISCLFVFQNLPHHGFRLCPMCA